jgi:hypothetical protein
MDLKDQFRYLVRGYYGVKLMDEYVLKEYILKDIEEYIKDFIEVNPIEDFDYIGEAEYIKDKVPNKSKLQDSLLVLNKVKAPMDLVLLVKQRLKIYK